MFRAGVSNSNGFEGRIRTMSRVGGPQESIIKSCVYYKMHYYIIFRAYFEKLAENIAKRAKIVG
jgi:hypothetical protein